MGAKSKMGGSITVIPNGGKLLELRQARDLTQKQVEQACGIRYLFLYEGGKPASIQAVKALALFYGVKPQSLVESESWDENADLMRQLVEFQGFTISVPVEERAVA